ncbi:hemocyte protein-glutamine gamma-glutamyltransferase-like [Physella acuta]|uniref:hemocyte protein-glutamine gamma-glutamyltransferase-like n=1 Tax=Physella acuta TaxID=109671 RepID=UPI0027DBDA46|nr:hemocyte protein-glutamine gamma-glutamyltransferase-like [Physella acuta]
MYRRRESGTGRFNRHRQSTPTRFVEVESEVFNFIRRFYVYGNESGIYIDTRSAEGPATPPPIPEDILKVVSVDLQIPTNSKKHNTHKYDLCRAVANPKLVVRRGQPFTIQVEFTKEYDANTDDLRIAFEAGDTPLESKGTSVQFILSDEDRPKEWGAKIVSQQGNQLTIEVYTPPTCYIGKWNLKIDVVKKLDTNVNVYRYQHADPIYILFNPWCKDDLVYMKDTTLLKEYVMNDVGKIYSGTKNSITGKPWNFAQFETCILDVALYLLDVAKVGWSVRGNPVPIVRKLSAMVNSADDGGVLTGNWSGEYADGRSPLSWTGSAAILEEYWRTKRPVKYGQCWVFSGIATTICRALGIPARSVTNYSSAHDTDGSITIDVHFTADGESDENSNFDSIWNFHVWNEVWMSRPDLPSGYGGWQVIDATPQETSDDIYCCGPTSVMAIRQGEVNLPYDGPFVFSEVNADCFYWVPNELGQMEVSYMDKKSIGKNISTKAPNSDDREDLTMEYKPDEGTSAERAAVLRANQVGSSRKDLYKQRAKDIEFNIDQNEEANFVGGNFELSFRMRNRGTSKRSVSGRIDVRTMFYTGVVADLVKSETFKKKVIKPGEEISHKIVATQADYDTKLKDGCMLDVTVWAVVEETDQYFTKKDDFRLRKPHLAITAPTESKIGQEFSVEVSFVNPLNRELTGCFVAVDGLTHALNFPQGNVPANGTFLATLPVTPTKSGKTELIIVFNSNELEDINVAHHVTVKKA